MSPIETQATRPVLRAVPPVRRSRHPHALMRGDSERRPGFGRSGLALALLLAAPVALGGCDDALGLGGNEIAISGTVRLAGDDSPVQGARLVATTNRTGEWSQLQRVAVRSGPDGRYSVALKCPSGAQLSVFFGYESGTSVLGEPGRDDLVMHSAERNGRILDDGLLDERVQCTTSRRWTVDFLLKHPIRGPAPVASGHSFVLLSAGAETVCGIAQSGSAYCWGNGALGDGRYRQYNRPGSAPVAVANGLVFTEISASSDLVCGVTAGEQAYCWGGYHTNAIGDGALAGSPRLTPRRVSGDHRFRTITTGGDHACALTPEAEAYCWGANLQGQLGTGSPGAPSPSPVSVGGGHRFTSIVAGGHHTCALTEGGTAYCWGNGAALGAGVDRASAVPVAVAGGRAFVTLSSGTAHTCGLTTDGEAHCWGWNSAGQLGHGGSSPGSLVPVPVAGGHSFTSISAGFEHTCAVAADQRIRCWGSNRNAQFGSPQPAESGTPVAVLGQHQVSAVAAGLGGAWGAFSCSLDPNGTASCWGVNSSVLGSGL